MGNFHPDYFHIFLPLQINIESNFFHCCFSGLPLFIVIVSASSRFSGYGGELAYVFSFNTMTSFWISNCLNAFYGDYRF